MTQDTRLPEMLSACIQQLIDELTNESTLYYLPPASLTEAWALLKAYGENSNKKIIELKEAFTSALYIIVVKREVEVAGVMMAISPPANAIKMALMLCQSEKINLDPELDVRIGTNVADVAKFMEESGRSTTKLKTGIQYGS